MAAVAASAIAARTARADSVCFPPGGGGVPGQPGLPDWWTASAPYDDPRWIGSYGFSHGTENFNALVETTGGVRYLLLRWHVTPDPGQASPGDQVLIGFQNTTTHDATVLQLTRDATTSTTAGLVGAGVMTANAYVKPSGGSLWAPGTVPTEVRADARLDATCDSSAFPPTCDDWVIRLRVPLAASSGGIDLGTSFAMWYEVDVQHGATGTTDQAKWPVGAATADLTAVPPFVPDPAGSVSPASAAWFTVSTAGGMCVAGIDIVYSDISVQNMIGAGTQIDVNSANTFHAKPTNNTTTAYNPNSIKANLRLADWGSAIGDSPRWQTIPDPSCAAATGSGTPGSITGGTRFDLQCSWTLTPGQQCSYRPTLFPGCTPDPTLGTRYPHQCIMAELSSTAAPIPFSTSSAWNNFDFEHSSKLERKARIDIGNLSPRDVYVYVRANNMPAVVPPAPPPGNDQGQTPGLSGALRERLAAVGQIVPGRVTEKQAQALRTLAATGKISYADVEKVMPTYTVYVWHDTGTMVKSSKLLAPQPSFTLFVSHDGPLVGWKHALLGTGGATVTEIAPHFYKLSVGSAGSTEVVTSIEAIEQEAPPPGGTTPPTWLLILILLAILLLVIIMFMRRKKHPAGP